MRNIFFPHYLSGEPLVVVLVHSWLLLKYDFVLYRCRIYAIKKEYRLVLLCDPFGARTQDPNIKSVVLYQLS